MEGGAARGDGGPPAPAPCRSRAAHWPGRPLAAGTVASRARGGWRGRRRRRGRGTRPVGAAEGRPQGAELPSGSRELPRRCLLPRRRALGPRSPRPPLGLRVRRVACDGAVTCPDSAGTVLRLRRRPPSPRRRCSPPAPRVRRVGDPERPRTLSRWHFPGPAGGLSPFYRCGLEAGRGRAPGPRPRRAGLRMKLLPAGPRRGRKPRGRRGGAGRFRRPRLRSSEGLGLSGELRRRWAACVGSGDPARGFLPTLPWLDCL